MAVRPAVVELCNLGLETTKGTEVASSKRLMHSRISINPVYTIQTVRPDGYKFATGKAVHQKWARGSVSGTPAYNELPYYLASILKKVTPTQPAAVSDPTVYDWTFEPAATAEDDYATYSVENGQSVRAHQALHVAVNALGLTVPRSGDATLSGEVIGRDFSDGITLTASPTEVSGPIIVADEWAVYSDPTSGALGTTQLTNPIEIALEIGDRRNPAWRLNNALTSWSALYEGVPSFGGSIQVDADAAGMGLLVPLEAEATRFLRFRSVGSIISNAYRYQTTWDLAVKFGEPNELSNEDGALAIQFPFDIVYDSTWAKALSVVVRCTLAAL